MDIISVIVCTYNQESTLPRTLDAIISQKCEWQFEVIIGEDASTDNTRKICEEYVKRFPDVVYLMPAAPNKGVVENYADCIRKAKGKYVMECGGDDEWCPGRMQLCLETIERYPNVNQVFTRIYYRNDKTGEITEPTNNLFPFGFLRGKDVIKGMMRQKSSQHISYAITRRSAIIDVMEKYPTFFAGKRYLTEDKQLIVLLATIGDFMYIHDRTYYYTIDTNSITRGNIRKHIRYNVNMLRLNHDLAKAIGYSGSLLPEYLHTIYVVCRLIMWRVLVKIFPFIHNIRH